MSKKKYKQIDLGYFRAPTDAIMHIDVDGETWGIPIQLIVDSRDTYYREDKEDTIGFIRKGSLTRFEIEDWVSNNMDWKDVEEYATRLVKKFIKPPSRDEFAEGLCNGDKSFEGKI